MIFCSPWEGAYSLFFLTKIPESSLAILVSTEKWASNVVKTKNGK
ncbi:hypothetical protein [Desulfothermus naphthae]